MYCKGKPIPKIAENEIQNPCIFGTLKLFDEFSIIRATAKPLIVLAGGLKYLGCRGQGGAIGHNH